MLYLLRRSNDWNRILPLPLFRSGRDGAGDAGYKARVEIERGPLDLVDWVETPFDPSTAFKAWLSLSASIFASRW
jgi:hypothetical protein